MAAKFIQYDSPSSSSSSPKLCWNHDVFLSFMGKDTRKNFTDHVYTALIQAGIHTFRDDDELPRGKEISSQLLKAIQESRISIIVFSENYASSRWCLDELVKIIECKNTIGQLVLPLFYNVDPSDIRKQSGTFAEAFARHEKRFVTEIEKVNRWRDALTEAANLSGWDSQNVANGHESKFIRKIVEEVLRKVNHTYLNVAMHIVGMDSRIEDVNLLLNIESDDVRMIGIYGMGGIGKTTIAKAVYNLVFQHFEGSCFLASVREVSEQLNGLVHLQEQLVSEILMKKNLKIGNVDRGISLVKERLRSKRVLIILDDLDQKNQFNALAGKRSWFGSGSRIIITTRDEHLLNDIEVDEKYEAKELNYSQSLQLFNWHAFRKTIPMEDYVELSNGIIRYTGGLPLALEVLGSYLFGRTTLEWKSAFEKLKQIPHNQIQKKLRISFDALDDDKVKDIFLDIACFFIGMDKDYVINVFRGSGFFPEIGISVLTNRCLLTINEHNELRMHDLLRDMGREIIREESPKHPGKRSRLWFHEDVCHVMENDKPGTESVEGIVLALPVLKEIYFNTKAFARMHDLRLLQINHVRLDEDYDHLSKEYVHLDGDYDHLPKKLQWLCWHYCPLKYLPSNFHLESLVFLDMRYSNFKTIWQDKKLLENLTILDLSYSNCLTKSPDFIGAPRLETLLLEGCTSLNEVHPSIGSLTRLVHLNLEDCKNLRGLPSSICELKSLELLNLTGCSSLEQLPGELGSMEGLKKLLANRTTIKQLPNSVGHLKNLTNLSLRGCNKKLPSISCLSLFSSWISSRSSPVSPRFFLSSISGLCSLKNLDLSYCNLSEGDLPVDLGSLSSLEILVLEGNYFCSLSSNLCQLSKLNVLRLDKCTNLQSLQLPPNLERLDANNCISIEKLQVPSNFRKLHSLYLQHCDKLAEIQGLENFDSVQTIHMESFSKVAITLSDTFFKSSEIPDWFSHQREGSSISFSIPSHEVHKFVGITLWVVYAADEDGFSETPPPIAVIEDLTNGVEMTYVPSFYLSPVSCEEHSWVSYISKCYFERPIEGGERMKVSIESGIDNGIKVKVKKCGIHLVYKPDIKGDDQEECSCIKAGRREIIYPNTGRDDEDVVETGSDDLSNIQAYSNKLMIEQQINNTGGLMEISFPSTKPSSLPIF